MITLDSETDDDLVPVEPSFSEGKQPEERSGDKDEGGPISIDCDDPLPSDDTQLQTSGARYEQRVDPHHDARRRASKQQPVHPG